MFQVCESLQAERDKTKNCKNCKIVKNSVTTFGMMVIVDEEEIAFADWINHALDGDCDVAHKLPLASNGHDMYAKADDGVMLCKMINLACPNTVDCRVINTGKTISIFKVILYGWLRLWKEGLLGPLP